MYTSAFYFPPIRVRLLSKGRAGVWEKSCDWSLRPSVLHYRSVFTVNVNIRQNLTPWISAYFCFLHRFTTTTKKHFFNELRIIASWLIQFPLGVPQSKSTLTNWLKNMHLMHTWYMRQVMIDYLIIYGATLILNYKVDHRPYEGFKARVWIMRFAVIFY